jgi:hypothetical protein
VAANGDYCESSVPYCSHNNREFVNYGTFKVRKNLQTKDFPELYVLARYDKEWEGR